MSFKGIQQEWSLELLSELRLYMLEVSSAKGRRQNILDNMYTP